MRREKTEDVLLNESFLSVVSIIDCGEYTDACALIGRKLRREGVRKILPNEMND